MVTQQQIDRINELARKSRETELSPEEKAEQAELRALYVASFRESLVGHLENTYIVDEKGNKRKVTRNPNKRKK